MIPISRPSIRRKDMDSVLTCMVNDSLGPGERSRELAAAVAASLGIGGGVAVRDRFRALSLALEILDLPAGSRVAMDALAPAFYASVVTRAGLVPAPVDVEQGTVIPEARAVEAAKPAAVLTRTALGYVPAMREIADLSVPIIEDISEGIGSNTGDLKTGAFGRLVIVGMEPDHIITAGGGCLLLTATRADSSRIQDAAMEFAPEALLPDMNAALGLTQIRELERFISRRTELASLFSRAAMKGRHSLLTQPGDGENTHFTFPLVAKGAVNELMQYARKKGVETARAFPDSLVSRIAARESQPPDQDVRAAQDYPNAHAMNLRCVRFPLYPALTGKEAAEIERVLSTLP